MKPKLFYDGGCPLCRKEINHYIRIDHDKRIEWIDITKAGEQLSEQGLSFTDTMRLIHAIDRKGTPQVGIPAFLVIWDELPGYRWLAAGLRFTRTVRPLNWLYYRFANWRFRCRCKTDCTLMRD